MFLSIWGKRPRLEEKTEADGGCREKERKQINLILHPIYRDRVDEEYGCKSTSLLVGCNWFIIISFSKFMQAINT